MYRFQNLTHCASTAARSAASCAAGSSEAGGASELGGTDATLGVGLVAALETSATDGVTVRLAEVDAPEVVGPSVEPEVQAVTPSTTAAAHSAIRQRPACLFISTCLPGRMELNSHQCRRCRERFRCGSARWSRSRCGSGWGAEQRAEGDRRFVAALCVDGVGAEADHGADVGSCAPAGIRSRLRSGSETGTPAAEVRWGLTAPTAAATAPSHSRCSRCPARKADPAAVTPAVSTSRQTIMPMTRGVTDPRSGPQTDPRSSPPPDRRSGSVTDPRYGSLRRPPDRPHGR